MGYGLGVLFYRASLTSRALRNVASKLLSSILLIMNLYLFWKLCRILRVVKRLVAGKGVVVAKTVTPWMFWIGAYDIDPKYLFFVIGAQTDRERDRLRADQQFSEQLMQTL